MPHSSAASAKPSPADRAKKQQQRQQQRNQRPAPASGASSDAAAASSPAAVKAAAPAPAAPAFPSLSVLRPRVSGSPAFVSPSVAASASPFKRFWFCANHFVLEGEIGGRKFVQAKEMANGAGATEHASAGSSNDYEARWRRESLAVLRADAQGADLTFAEGARLHSVSESRFLRRPSEAAIAELEQRYAEMLRKNLPQFDLAEAEDDLTASAAENNTPAQIEKKQRRLAKARNQAVAALLSDAPHTTTGATPSGWHRHPHTPHPSHEVTFERYAGMTQALLRLTTENPPLVFATREHRRRRQELAPTTAAVVDSESSLALTDPQYPLRLISRYWSSLSSPASPFPASYQRNLAWWKMMSAVHVLLGTVVRPAADRSAIIQGLIARMKNERVVVADSSAAPTNVYDDALKHETFFRALFYAAVNTGDLPFAVTLLRQIPQLTRPSKQTPSSNSGASEILWKSVSKHLQMAVYQEFMARCCAEIHLQQNGFDAMPTPPVAAAPQRSYASPVEMDSDALETFALRTFHALYPALSECMELITQQREMLGNAASAVANPETALSGSSMLDLLFHAFRSQLAGGIAPSIRVYNFLIYALTHSPTVESNELAGAAASSLPSAVSLHSLLMELLQTVVSERVAHLNFTSFRLLLEFCLRGDGNTTFTHATQPSLSAGQLAILDFTLQQLQATLAANKAGSRAGSSREEGSTLTLEPLMAQLLVQACYAKAKATSDGSPSALAAALRDFHAAWAPLLSTATLPRAAPSAPASDPKSSVRRIPPPTTALQLWHRTVFAHLAALGSSGPVRAFLAQFGEALTEDDMRAALEAIASEPPTAKRKLAVIDAWMRGGNEGEDGSAVSAAAADRPAGASAVPAADAASLAAATSMDVSGVLLRWVQAKASLSYQRRLTLGLRIDESASDTAEPHVASVLSAAQYVIFHSRKMQLERDKMDANAPLTIPTLYEQPTFGLPASVLSAPNFSTGWLLLCCGWVQQEGDIKATRKIKAALDIVQQAARGDNSWIQAQQAAAKPPTPSPSTDPPAAPTADDGSEPRGLLQGSLRWMRTLSTGLVADVGSSVHIFSAPPPSSPLIELNLPFKLHPQLLHSILHAFQSLSEYREAAAQWMKLFRQLDPYLPLFDLSQHNPILVKLFQYSQ